MASYITALRNKIGSDMLIVPSVAAVIHDADGKILLQEKMSGEAWSLPAGAIELGETPRQAIIREVREETGFEVSVQEIIDVFGGRDFRYVYPNGDRVEYVVTLFACRIERYVSAPPDNETKSIRYFSQAEMPPLALPYSKAALFNLPRP
ncbi:NUDIX domain-containing protein [Rhizobium skierniewicense]|uniref:NUDIX domain-containing protein n=1 Tax=Rhizobium skierniewicense TaxID=984260 RepID=UPI001573A6A1|nr:NUDIX domain-containing protein [Rhizobium skierniewicense]NTF31329.1 NUDIX domain-containing protein [Rhizobium skierniewicense]